MRCKKSEIQLRWTRLLALGVVLWLGFGIPADAAIPTGTIVGTVVDPSGAVIAEASVTVTHQETGASRSMTTDAAGNFHFPSLPVGPYTLKVEKPGFQMYTQKDIILQVDQNLTVRVIMQLGAVTQEVMVVGITSGVDLLKSTINEVVDQRRIVDLPLNGRDPLQLQLLMPGVTLDTNSVGHGQGQHEGVTVNGNRPASNYYLMDGVDAVDSYLAVAPTFPSPDALQEFSVNTSAFSAEYGRNAGALVNAVTKSGTNEWHGTAFEFLRNDRLNANNFFANRAGIARPPFKLNQFGGTVGGPIRKDRTFIFGYFQETLRRKSNAITVPNVLTAQERPDRNPNGVADFNAICPGPACPNDPRTGRPFLNNIILANRLDPTALNFIKAIMPLPNSGRSFTFSAPLVGNNDNLDETQFIMRFDHAFNEANRVFVRYYFNKDTIKGIGRGNIPNTPHLKRFQNQNAGVNWTHSFSSTALNTATVGFNRLFHFRSPEKSIAWRDFGGPPFALAGRDVKGDLYVTISDSLTSSGDGVFQQPRTNYQYADTLSWVRGRHALKFGGEYRRETVNRFEDFFTDPTLSFNGQFTGNALADLLLGLPNSFRQDAEVRSQLRHSAPSLFVTDNVKVLPNLTLDLGIRWEPYLAPVDNLNDQICFDPTFTKRSAFYPTAPPGMLFPGGPHGRGFGKGDAGCPRDLIDKRWANFAPRGGIVWDPFKKGKTSVRAGYGIFWDQIRLIGYNRFSTAVPFSFSANIFSPGNPSNNFAPSLTGTSIFTNAGVPNPFPFEIPRTPAQRAAFSPLFGGNWPAFSLENTINPDWNQGYIQEYNFNIQQELFRNYTLTVAYVGNTARHLWLSHEINFPIPLPFSQQPFSQQLATTNQRRRLSSIQCKDAQGRSNPCYGPFALINNPGWSHYNSLQITVNRKFTGGLTLLGSYVWAKYIDLRSFGTEGDSGPRNPFNFDLDKALSDNDVAHRFVISYIWQVPIVSKYKQGALNQWVNGWQLNGITTIQSGTPFTVVSGRDRSLTAIGKDTADALPGQNPKLDTGRSHAQLIQEYFNGKAFQVAAEGTFGNVGRNTLRGPGIVNFDFAIFKDFPFSERWGKIQFRNEYFNIFNNVNFGQPAANLASPSSFGRIFSARDPRFVQFALKWIF